MSNLLFGAVQYRIALSQGIPFATLLALQLSGAALGNMASLANIVAVAAVLGVKNQVRRCLLVTSEASSLFFLQEGAVLKLVAIPSAFVIVLSVPISWIFYS